MLGTWSRAARAALPGAEETAAHVSAWGRAASRGPCRPRRAARKPQPVDPPSETGTTAAPRTLQSRPLRDRSRPARPARSAVAHAATSGSTSRKPKHVTNPADGMQQGQPVNIDLPAQVTDVGLKHAGITTEVITPHMVKQLSTCEHPARI